VYQGYKFRRWRDDRGGIVERKVAVLSIINCDHLRDYRMLANIVVRRAFRRASCTATTPIVATSTINAIVNAEGDADEQR